MGVLLNNPIMNADMPDPDLLRIGDNEIYRLENGKHAYGKGQWATSLKEYQGRYYACFVCHDMSFLFWQGKAYLIYGCGDIGLVELNEDLSGLKENGERRILLETEKEGIMLRCEGCRALVRNGYLYLFFIDWPVLGIQGKVPMQMELPFEEYKAAPLVISDSFDHHENRLALQWQWNHNPDSAAWSFTERPGYLRLLNNRVSGSLMDARNTLTQRTIEPECICQVILDASGLQEGDYAGLCVFQYQYGQIGVTVREGQKYVLAVRMQNPGDGIPKEQAVRLTGELQIFVISESSGETAQIL